MAIDFFILSFLGGDSEALAPRNLLPLKVFKTGTVVNQIQLEPVRKWTLENSLFGKRLGDAILLTPSSRRL